MNAAEKSRADAWGFYTCADSKGALAGTTSKWKTGEKSVSGRKQPNGSSMVPNGDIVKPLKQSPSHSFPPTTHGTEAITANQVG